jgi:hypothetical protein
MLLLPPRLEKAWGFWYNKSMDKNTYKLFRKSGENNPEASDSANEDGFDFWVEITSPNGDKKSVKIDDFLITHPEQKWIEWFLLELQKFKTPEMIREVENNTKRELSLDAIEKIRRKTEADIKKEVQNFRK